MMKYFAVFVLVLSIMMGLVGLTNNGHIALAQDAHIDTWEINPTGDVAYGTWLTVRCKGNDGTTRITVNGIIKAEEGDPDLTTTIKTEEFVSSQSGGSLHLECQLRGNSGGWEAADYRDAWVNVSAAPSSESGSDDGNENILTTGGMDFNGYCRSLGYDRETHNPGNAYSYKCALDNQETDVDVFALCQWQYSGQLPYVGLRDANDANSWYCASTPQPTLPQQTQPQNGGEQSGSGNGSVSEPPGHGMDILGWCQSKGKSGTINTGDAFGWGCTNDDGSWAFSIDIDPVCQFSSGGVYPYAHLGDQADPSSWTCENYPQGDRPEGQPYIPPTNPIQPQDQPNENDSGSVSSGETFTWDGYTITQGDGQCQNALPPQMILGGRGRVTYTDGSPTSVKKSPGGSSFVSLPEGTEFDVLNENPNCTGGYLWYHVQLDDGRTGYMTEGRNDGDYWIEPAPGNQPSGGNIVELSYNYSAFGETYTFRVDKTDTNNCVILNGSEIVAQEINRARNWLRNSSNIPADFLLYMKSDGHIDTFRVAVDSFLVRNAGCMHSFYQVGEATMDLSGLGNVAFGYFTTWLPSIGVHMIADFDQLAKERRLDYPDDASQIDLGRAIAESKASVNSDLVESKIPGNFVNSQ